MMASVVAAWWGAATGTASTLLFGARFLWDRGGDRRERRAKQRAELREMAAGAKAELNAARTHAKTGLKVGPVGEWTQKCISLDHGLTSTVERLLGLRKNPNVLRFPKRKELWRSVTEANLAVLDASFAWQRLAGVEEFPNQYTSDRRAIETNEFLRSVGPAHDLCSSVVKALNEIED